MTCAQAALELGEDGVSSVGGNDARCGVEHGGVGIGKPRETPVIGVQLDVDVGIPAAKEAERAANLRRLGLHEIAIQCQPLPVVVGADGIGSALVGSVQRDGSTGGITVGVCDGHDHKDNGVEQARRIRVGAQQVADETEHGILGIDFAGRHARLDVDHRAARGVRVAAIADHGASENHDGIRRPRAVVSVVTSSMGPRRAASAFRKLTASSYVAVWRKCARSAGVGSSERCGEAHAASAIAKPSVARRVSFERVLTERSDVW